MEPTVLSQLKDAIPCRTTQIKQLYNLFAHDDEPFPDTIYLYGGPSSGKSIVATTLLEKLGIRHAIINLIECYTPKILFESILDKLCPGATASATKCDNMMDFVGHLQKHRDEISGSVLIIDKAEKLRSMDLNLFLGFFRLKELTGINLGVMLMSEIILQKYYARANNVEPIKIHFPQYNKEELLEILAKTDFDYARSLMKNAGAFEFDLDFYRNYLNVFLSVFYRNCRDLSELRYNARANFPKYCRPIVNNESTINDSMALWRKIAPELKQAMQGLYLRISSASAKHQHQDNNLAQDFELPFYAKYLLIAAYLASYNSAKDDKRLFVKHHGKKTKTMRDVKQKAKVSEQLSTQLGPKSFSFDRLLAIFYTIYHKDTMGFNNHLLIQLSSLVELQLLSSSTDKSSLNGPKYRCNVNFDFIHSISKMVGFNIRKYLSDFSHI